MATLQTVSMPPSGSPIPSNRTSATKLPTSGPERAPTIPADLYVGAKPTVAVEQASPEEKGSWQATAIKSAFSFAGAAGAGLIFCFGLSSSAGPQILVPLVVAVILGLNGGLLASKAADLAFPG